MRGAGGACRVRAGATVHTLDELLAFMKWVLTTLDAGCPPLEAMSTGCF
jgi:hypothetical protein